MNNKPKHTTPDPDAHKGSLEPGTPDEKGNVSIHGQLPHRSENPLIKENDSDFPEPGENPEHTGEPEDGGILTDRRRSA